MIRFSQYFITRFSKVWDRSLFLDDLERLKIKVTAGGQSSEIYEK